MKPLAKSYQRTSIWVSILTAAALLASPMAAAEECASPCQDQLTAIDPYTETIRILWFPKSEYRWVSHTAIEVGGQVWTRIRKIAKKPTFETYVRNANIHTGFLSISIRVTPEELENLDHYLTKFDGTDPSNWKIRLNPYWIYTCSNGIYRLLTDRRIINSPVFPTTVPYVMVAKLALEKAYGNPRIAGIEWIGRKPDRLLPFLRGSLVETAMFSAYLSLITIPLHDLNEPVLNAMRDVSRLAMALAQ